MRCVQHYLPGSAQSTLAGSLWKTLIQWPYLGTADLSEEQVGDWTRSNTGRDHCLLNARGCSFELNSLE
jgi:hypothetical protein